MTLKPLAFTCLLALSAVLCAADVPAPAPAPEEFAGISKPSQDVTLSFARPGRIDSVPVKEGDIVKKGQLVIKMDSREETAALELDRFKAQDATKVEAQVAILAQKKIDYEKLKNTGVATRFEIDNSKLEVTIAEANLKLSRFEHDQDGRKYEQTKATVERLTLYSPFDGIIETLLVKEGEGVDQQSKVMRIVKIDPLWVESPVRLSEAKKLKIDQAAQVKFSDGHTRDGKIVHIASVADSASETILVRIEIPNDKKTPAGERVSVRFTPVAPPRQ